ncbi:MAG: lipoprotein signal peptidase [Saprospiraceae bacterium]
MKRSYFVILVIALVLLLDQWLKIYIKTNFEYNQEEAILGLSWARLHFVENEGMAFGITFGWKYGKLLLSVFRILMVVGLAWYIRLLIKLEVPLGFLASIGLITAGAIGNILDSALYGLIFSESPYHGGLAELVGFGEGYGTFLHGKVVDMLYFPITWIHVPEWIPWMGGGDYLFFSPIFNIADAAITCGVLSIILFQRSFFKDNPLELEEDKRLANVLEEIHAAENPPAEDTNSEATDSEADKSIS